MQSGIFARILAVALTGTLASQQSVAQHATANDIADGARAYRDTCANCHGPDGNLIEGIDLGRGLYRRPLSDSELAEIILNGIPGTPMPPNPGMVPEQADKIVAYLRDLSAEFRDPAAGGDRIRGREIFFGEGECTECHAVLGTGARHGPDLSNIGRERRAIELEAALIDPGAVVQPTGRTYRVVSPGGEVVTGRLLNHDTFTVQIIDTDERLRSFDKASLADFGFVESTMPAYGEQLSGQEIADLVSFLVSLQEQE
jgi:putative heme-binding domain-containing protein